MKTKIAVSALEDVAYDQLFAFDGNPLTLMISGGSIIRVLEHKKIAALNKNKWVVYFADERCVPAEDKQSNRKQAENFLEGVGEVVAIDISVSPDEALRIYRERLQNAKFDLAILGIGEDGHIASVFPGSPIIDSSDIVAHITDSPKPPEERITVTPRMLTMVKKLVFLIPRLPNGMLKAVEEPHFSILSRLNTDILIATAAPLANKGAPAEA